MVLASGSQNAPLFPLPPHPVVAPSPSSSLAALAVLSEHDGGWLYCERIRRGATPPRDALPCLSLRPAQEERTTAAAAAPSDDTARDAEDADRAGEGGGGVRNGERGYVPATHLLGYGAEIDWQDVRMPGPCCTCDFEHLLKAADPTNTPRFPPCRRCTRARVALRWARTSTLIATLISVRLGVGARLVLRTSPPTHPRLFGKQSSTRRCWQTAPETKATWRA